jgi:hypothetical protein
VKAHRTTILEGSRFIPPPRNKIQSFFYFSRLGDFSANRICRIHDRYVSISNETVAQSTRSKDSFIDDRSPVANFPRCVANYCNLRSGESGPTGGPRCILLRLYRSFLPRPTPIVNRRLIKILPPSGAFVFVFDCFITATRMVDAEEGSDRRGTQTNKI